MSDTTLSSDRILVAFFSAKEALKTIWRHVAHRPEGMHVRRLNDHLARDIGLSEAEVARNRLTLPSQTHHHPYG